MKNRVIKLAAFVLCGLLVFEGSVAPAWASEPALPETVYVETTDEARGSGGWTSAFLDNGPGKDSDYVEIDSGSGSVKTGSVGEKLTTGAAAIAISKVLVGVDPALGAYTDVIVLIIGITPDLIVDGFEKYAPQGMALDYTYTKYKNEKDSTLMYEYYRYDVTYYIGDHPIPRTFYETRTFN